MSGDNPAASLSCAGLPGEQCVAAARSGLRGLNFFERCACLELLSDEDLLALAAAQPQDVAFIAGMLEGIFAARLNTLRASLSPAAPIIDAQRLALAADHVAAASEQLQRMYKTPEQAQAMDAVAGLLLSLDSEELCEAVAWVPWPLTGALISQAGGEDSPLGRHVRQCSADWGFVADWLSMTRDGRLLRRDVDEWLTATAGVLPGFAWTPSEPVAPRQTPEPEYTGWLAFRSNSLEPLAGSPAPDCFAFPDFARLEREDIMVLLRDETPGAMARAMPRDPDDPARQALLSCMSTVLQEVILEEAEQLQPTWAMRARAQEEVAAHVRRLEARGSLWFPWGGQPRPVERAPVEPAAQEEMAGDTPAPPRTDDEALALLLAETHALRRLVCDLTPRDLRGLLSELSVLDIEAVASAAPMDTAFLDHVCSGLAHRVGVLLREVALAPERQIIPAGQLREALGSVRAVLAKLEAGHATEEQLQSLSFLANRLLRAHRVGVSGLKHLPRQFPVGLNLALILRTGGVDGFWARLVRKGVSPRGWQFLKEDLAIVGLEPLTREEAEAWLPQAQEATADLTERICERGNLEWQRHGSLLARLKRKARGWLPWWK